MSEAHGLRWEWRRYADLSPSADGTEKQIKDVKVGDQVKATDPQTGRSKSELVQRVIVGKGLKHLVDVSVLGETVEATYNHPFWVVEDQKFEWATDLKVGEHVLLASGKTLPVVGVARHDEITTVYNLSIQQIHTFFVGDEPVLVHNSCGSANLLGLPAPRKVEAAWGAGVYKEGGLMTSIEHISYRHAFESGFENVSRFAEGTSARDIMGYVDEAMRYGDVNPTGTAITHDLGRYIGTDQAGNAVTGIRMYISKGIIRTAFPVGV